MKLLVLDKDGTLVRPKSGARFVQHPEDQELLPGVAEAIAHYAAEGWTMAIASNQGGVAAGHKTLDDAIAEMRYCLRLLRNAVPDIRYQHKCPIFEALFCPDFQGSYCWSVQWGVKAMPIHECEWIPRNLHGEFRKPSPGMLNFFNLRSRWSDSLMAGDRPEDEQAARAARVRFMWADQWRLSSDRPSR